MHMNYKLVVGALLLVLLAWMFWGGDKNESVESEPNPLDSYDIVTAYDGAMTRTEPLTVADNNALVLPTDGVLTVEADVTIDGALACDSGSMTLVVTGALTINDAVFCQGETGDITIVASGGLVMAEQATIAAGGNVQLVDATAVVRDEAALNALYESTAAPAERGFAIGPIVEDDSELDSGAPETTAVSTDPWWTYFGTPAHA